MPRYRFSADIVTDDELTDFQLDQVKENAAVLTVAAAPNDVDGVTPNLRVEIVSSVHQHESTDMTRCAGCRHMSMDGWNSDSQD